MYVAVVCIFCARMTLGCRPAMPAMQALGPRTMPRGPRTMPRGPMPAMQALGLRTMPHRAQALGLQTVRRSWWSRHGELQRKLPNSAPHCM